METRKAELLIDEYLQSKNCENTRKAISVKPSTEKNEMMLQNQKSIKPFPSGLEYMISKKMVDTQVWTEKEMKALKKAVKSYTGEKSERWKEVGKAVGKSKKECYEKYKELKEEKKKKEKEIFHVEEREVISQCANEKPEGNMEDVKDLNVQDMKIEDCEDFEDFDTGLSPQAVVKQDHTGTATNGQLLSSQERKALEVLLFGDSKKKFPTDWTQQALRFSPVKDLQYGLVQTNGGPCGVLAVVQAMFLKNLLFGSKINDDWSNPSDDEANKALIAALTSIIWQAGDGSACKVALKGSSNTQTNGDGVTEAIEMHDMHSEAETSAFIQRNLHQFCNEKAPGILLVVYSTIFSRSIDFILKDMDTSTGCIPTLIGAHNYCTQELVNLILVGRAASNVFDNDKELGDDPKDKMMLHGILKQGTVGLLTLFESYNYLVVGSNLKTPKYPIWVICSESHYSVLFSHDMGLLENSNAITTFNLYYYDGLANQTEVIKLTIDPTANKVLDTKDLIPPLNLVVQTRWPGADVHWNDTDPIL